MILTDKRLVNNSFFISIIIVCTPPRIQEGSWKISKTAHKGGGDTCSSFCRGGGGSSHPFREELFFPGGSSYFAIIIDNFFLAIEWESFQSPTFRANRSCYLDYIYVYFYLLIFMYYLFFTIFMYYLHSFGFSVFELTF